MNMKFYGLLKEKPLDRHKWFFAPSEAHKFISHHASLNKYSVAEYYLEGSVTNETSSIKRIIKLGIQGILRIIFRSDLTIDDLLGQTSWWVLKKQ